MKGRPHKYTAKELAWIAARGDWPRRALHEAFVAKFDRHEVSCDSIKRLCLSRGWKTGRTGQFVPGQESHNKGKKMPFNANSARTQFKKGNKPHTTKYLGHERVAYDGYIEISVAETNPHTGFERRYVAKHRHLWEKANGPIPENHVLKCLDGDKANSDPSNWEAIPRAMLPRLAGSHTLGYDDAPDELKPIIMATAKLEHAAREKRRGGKQ